MKRHIPNFLTLLNLLSGTVGIYFVFQGNLTLAAYAIWLGALLAAAGLYLLSARGIVGIDPGDDCVWQAATMCRCRE